MDQANKIGLAGTVGTWVGGVGVAGAIGVAAYKQNARNNARNNSSSAGSLPTMNDMTPQQRSDFERRRRNATQEQRDAEQRETQTSLDYEARRAKKLKKSAQAKTSATAPAASSSSSSPALPSTLPKAVRRAENSKNQPKPVIRGTAPGQQSMPSRIGPVVAPAAAVSGSDARGGAGRRQNSGTASSSTGSKSTRRGTEPKLGDSFLDMSE